MKKIQSIFALLVVALAGLSLTACSSDDLSTDQYGGDLSLGAFGPCPVLRGGTLFFYGTNLDQVTEVILPGSNPITAINVLERGYHSRIAIVVPAEGGTEGTVVLKAANGRAVSSVSPITFREDISISQIYIGTEGNLTGEVGDILTIKGDYLNLMYGVTFTGGYTVTDLIQHDRYTITVQIPKEAASGKITLTDLDEEMPVELQTSEAITINLPTVTATSASTLKAGGTLTITGTKLEQIESVELPGGVTIPEADLTCSTDGTTLSFVLPEEAADGDVTLVTYSGQKIVAGQITTVTPTNLAISGTVKNGQKMTITGTDLKLVSGVAFANSGDYSGEITINDNSIVIAKVPETAQDGDLTLKMKNGKTVTIAYTLVKPTVTSAEPAAFVAGAKIVLYGTNLDLVSAIVFPGDAPLTVDKFDGQEEEGIELTTPAAAYGTGITLKLKNGADDIVIPGIVTITAATQPAISESPASALAGDEITIKGKNFNNVANIYIGTYKVTRYVSRSNTEMTFKVPEDAPVGDYVIVMEDFDGNKFNGPAFAVAPAEFTIWSGEADNTTSWNNIEGIGSDAGTELKAAGAQAGWIARFYGEFSKNWFELRVIEGHWGDTYATLGVSDLKEGYVQMVLTQAILDKAFQQQWWGGTFIVSGQGFKLTKVTVASK